MDIYVGNLAFSTTDESLTETFEAFGSVESAKVINDRETGRSRGFGFVTMSDDSDAEKAIESLNGSEIDGRTLVVRKAEPRPPRPQGGGGGGGGGFRGGPRGGGGGHGGGGRGGFRGGRDGGRDGGGRRGF